MNVYLAGAMSGVPEQNFPAFYKAAERLRNHPRITMVCNPAEMNGPDPNRRHALTTDLTWICLFADAVIGLITPTTHWLRSTGARAEMATARALGLRRFQYDVTTDRLVELLSDPERVLPSGSVLPFEERRVDL